MALASIGGASVVFPDQRGLYYGGAWHDDAGGVVQGTTWFAEGLGIAPVPAQRVRDSCDPAMTMQPERVPPGTAAEQFTPAIDLLPGADS